MAERAAARAADAEVQRFASASYAALAAEIAADAQEVARAVDDAMRAVLAARLEHAAVAQRGIALIAATGTRLRPGAVPDSRIDLVASEIDGVFLRAGEVVPAPPESVRPPQAEEVAA